MAAEIDCREQGEPGGCVAEYLPDEPYLAVRIVARSLRRKRMGRNLDAECR